MEKIYQHDLLPAEGGGVCCINEGCGFLLDASEAAWALGHLIHICKQVLTSIESLGPGMVDEKWTLVRALSAVAIVGNSELEVEGQSPCLIRTGWRHDFHADQHWHVCGDNQPPMKSILVLSQDSATWRCPACGAVWEAQEDEG